jgi:transcriptional regulator of acetoin/glycerol metabolism
LARVQDGTFREDLYYRLNGLEISLPALRDRADKSQLLDFLLGQEAGEQQVALDPAARRVLLAFAWPGNVRQMRMVLRTLIALCTDGLVRLEDVPARVRGSQTAQANSVMPSVDSSLDVAERGALLAALAQQHWHMSQTAVLLGISRNTLYRKLRKYGIARQLRQEC